MLWLGAEAMLEWHHGAGRNLPVTQLIAIAEERGLIGRLTRRVLRLACTFVSENDIPWMQIALSPVFLRHEGAARIVLDILAEKNVEPKRLQIEIGESVLLEANGAALQAINTLRAMGTVIVLDDFGSGPSSMTMLRQRPVDKLKIDRSFVRALGSADPAAAIVKAVAELANALGIEVAAEGVETADQRTMLAALGCREIQGPLVSEPLTGMQLSELDPQQPVHEACRTAGCEQVAQSSFDRGFALTVTRVDLHRAGHHQHESSRAAPQSAIP